MTLADALLVDSAVSSQQHDQGHTASHLVAVDTGLPDLKTLLRHLPLDSAVCLVPQHADALTHLAQAAAGLPRGSLHGLHILGHGQPGRMQLGSGWVDASTVQGAGAAMAEIAATLADDAHIWLYGCHSAQGPAGAGWLDAWALATGAAVHGTTGVWSVQQPALLQPGTNSTTSNPLQACWQASGWAHGLPWLNQTPVVQSYPGKASGEFRNLFAFAALKDDGTVVTWGSISFGGDSSRVIGKLTNVQQVFSNEGAFAALKADGTVVTWGHPNYGGDSWLEVTEPLTNVQQVFSTGSAFAALKADGTVVTWGWEGGDSTGVISQLTNVQQVFSSRYAFAALKADGTVVTWGSAHSGGDSSAVTAQLTNVQQVYSSLGAFAALRADGTVVTWGGTGGNSSSVTGQLTNVQQVFSNFYAFAALKADGTVVTWGSAYDGGDSSAVTAQLTNVQQVFSTRGAFAALKADGTVVTWGSSFDGGEMSKAVAAQLTNVQHVFSTNGAFAALKADGTVVTWGWWEDGGSKSPTVTAQLTNVQQLFSTGSAFAALKGDGTVVTWGSPDNGGDSSAAIGQLTNVQEVFSTHGAFAALKADGTVVTWGGAGYGGSSSSVIGQLTNVVGVNTILTDDDYIVQDSTPPVLVAVSPSTEPWSSASEDTIFVFRFSEPVKLGEGRIWIEDVIGRNIETFESTSSQSLSVDGNTLTVQPADLSTWGTAGFIRFDPDVITDLSGNSYTQDGEYRFTLSWGNGPFVARIENSINHDSGDDIILRFSQDIKLGSGHIVLRRDSGSTVNVFDVETDDRIRVDGDKLVIDPERDLANWTDYRIDFGDGSILDLGNSPINHSSGAQEGLGSRELRIEGAAAPQHAPSASQQLLNQTQAAPANQEDLILFGAFFATLSYGDVNLSIATFSNSHKDADYSGQDESDDGFDDDYALLLSDNPQLGKNWELITGDILAGSDAAVVNVTRGGLYHAYIPSEFGDFHTDQASLTNGVLYGNSNAIVVKSDDTLVFAFRGTDGEDDAFIDGQTWTGDGAFLHYEAFRPLIEATLKYIENNGDVKHVVFSGHSLGGTLIDIFTAIDAWRFAELPGSDLTLVAMASAGISHHLITDVDGPETYHAVYDESVIRPSRLIEAPSEYLQEWFLGHTNPGVYHGFANSLDRVFFPVTSLAEVVGLIPNISLLEQSNFLSTAFFLPNVANNDASYGAGLTPNGFGLQHNSLVYYKNIHSLYNSPLYKYASYSKAMDTFVAREGVTYNLDGYYDESLGRVVGANHAYSNWNPTNKIVMGTGEYPASERWLESGVGDIILSDADGVLIRRALHGTSGGDFILGLEGDDHIFAGSGDDFLDGGPGADLLIGGLGNDLIFGGDGGDIIYGGDRGKNGGSVDYNAGDVVIYRGSIDDFEVRLDRATGAWKVSLKPGIDGDEGVDSLYGIEEVRFSDDSLVLINQCLPFIQDGYIVGAEVFVDVNGNGLAEAVESTGSFTDNEGRVEIESRPGIALIAVGGTNIDTGLPNTMVLSAPGGSSVVSPLTTLVQSTMWQSGMDVQSAEAFVRAALGITADIDLNQFDPLAQGATDPTGLAVQKVAAQVATLATLAPEGGTTFASIAANLISAGEQTLNLSDASVLQTILPDAPAQVLDQVAAVNQALGNTTSLTDITALQLAVTTDTTPPTATAFSPTDGATGVAVSANIVLTFSEAVQRGSGDIVLKTAAGTIVETLSAANSDRLSFSGSALSIDPTANLAYATGYLVEIPASSVQDLVGNDFAGTANYDFTTAAAQPLSKDDNFVAAQYASPAILGSGPGNDTYLLSSSLLAAGTSMTISDAVGSNSVQLAPGLAIASSRVSANALQITLANGSVITLLGAAAFGYDAAANSSAGIDGTDLSYASFALQVLGVAVPTGSTLNTGGAVVIGGGAGLPAFPAGTKSDDFVVAQYASPAILGAGTGDDTYLLSPSLLPPATSMTISDAVGSNSVQLANGLEIASSRVASTALQLTLVNGSVITVLGAAAFGYEAGGNRSAGIDGADLSYAAFALQVLGVAVPASGIAVGGPVLIGATGQAGTITVPVGSMAPLTATAGADVFAFDVGAARAITANTQIDISGFATASDRLRLDLPVASGASTLAALDGQQGLSVQFDPFAAATVVNFGPDADGNIVAITLLGVSDPALVQVEVV